MVRTARARFGRLLAVVVLAVTGGTLAAPQPAGAAAPPMFVWSTVVGEWGAATTYCLDQHYQGNTPTTTVYSWTPCHSGGASSPGNQLWRFEHLGGNVFRIMNRRGNYTWCLSAPNGAWSLVYAEYCVTSPQIPAKQKWRPVDVGGINIVHNLGTGGQCMTARVVPAMNDRRMQMRDCDGRANQRWTWSAP